VARAHIAAIRPAVPGRALGPGAGEGAGTNASAPAPPALARPSWWRVLARRIGVPGAALLVALLALVVALRSALQPLPAPGLAREAFTAEVERSLENLVIPSQASRAHAAISPSVVLVEAGSDAAAAGTDPAAPGSGVPRAGGTDRIQGIGSGVVIVDKGIILTNLHVVEGATSIRITFADGTRSAARVIGTQPENDLAVLQALTVPDDLVAASLGSSADLRSGDLVVAVGFPFGVGPSTSAGVVSGLKREYAGADGRRLIGNLIQFDAAANPGNSGGPLVNAEGEVVGIVTGILSPGTQRTFIGIGFAVPIEGAASAVGVPPF
jgi:S1-C subfamily serine protease